MDVEQLPEEEFTLGVSELFDLQIETLSLFFLLFDLRMFSPLLVQLSTLFSCRQDTPKQNGNLQFYIGNICGVPRVA